MTDLPNEIMVWHSMEKLTHIGTWATERYPEEAVAYVPLADAQAAQAMVVERAAKDARDVFSDHKDAKDAIDYMEQLIYAALAPIDGLALVRELRDRAEKAEAERDQARGWLGAANNEFGSAAWDWPDLWRRIAQLKELSNERWKRAETAEAQLAEAQKRETDYQEALIWCSGSEDFQADGQARAGWLKLCAPLIDRAALSAAPTGEESHG